MLPPFFIALDKKVWYLISDGVIKALPLRPCVVICPKIMDFKMLKNRAFRGMAWSYFWSYFYTKGRILLQNIRKYYNALKP